MIFSLLNSLNPACIAGVEPALQAPCIGGASGYPPWGATSHALDDADCAVWGASVMKILWFRPKWI